MPRILSELRDMFLRFPSLTEVRPPREQLLMARFADEQKGIKAGEVNTFMIIQILSIFQRELEI